MKELWKDRKEPIAYNLDDFLCDDANRPKRRKIQDSSELLEDQKEWSLLENVHVFLSSVNKLAERSLNAPLKFDKDDEDALDFVTSCSNLRSSMYHIDPPVLSRFKVKGNLTLSYCRIGGQDHSCDCIHQCGCCSHDGESAGQYGQGTRCEAGDQVYCA